MSESRPLWTPGAYRKALFFAAEAHGQIDQRFPGTELPYLVHVVLVASEVQAGLEAHAALGDALDGDLAVQCALLHDTLEDTKVTRAELAKGFGEAVAAGVTALSKDDHLGADQPADRRKALQMADSLSRIRGQPREVWLVKLADRISNLHAPPTHWKSDKRQRYRAEGEQILAALGEASAPLARRLADQIAAYARYLG